MLRDYIEDSFQSFEAGDRYEVYTECPENFEFLETLPDDVTLSAIQNFLTAEAAASRRNLVALLKVVAPHIVRLLSIEQIYELLTAIQNGLEWWSNPIEAD